MSDPNPTPGAGFTFLDYVALGFILSGVEEFLRRGKDGWPIWVPAFALGLIVLMFRDRSPQLLSWLSARFRAPKTIHQINFDYLPLSPLENGWTQAYNTPDGQIDFGSDQDIHGSLRMRKVIQSEVAINYNIPLHATLADHVEFTAKYTNTQNPTMIFTRLEVTTKDGSVRKPVWIKYYSDRTARALRTPGDWHNPASDLPEQTVWLPFKTLENGVMECDIDFHKSVKLALGDQGWIYNAVIAVRLRGNLSISPLVFRN